MKKILTMIALMAMASGCTVQFEPGTSRTNGFSPEVGYAVYDCSPRDYDYAYTEVDCLNNFWTIEVCDPDDVYYRHECWTEGEVYWSFDGCYIEHFCW